MKGPPRAKWVVRGLWALVGLIAFLWIGQEGRGLGGVVLLAACLTTASWITFLASGALTPGASRGSRTLKLAWTAALAGGATAPVCVLLMLVKVSLHGHIGPDFTGADVLWAISRAPEWALAGGLAGLAVALRWRPGAA